MPSGVRFDKDRARELLEEGLSYKQIAERLGCSPSGVKCWASRAGLTRRKAEKGEAAESGGTRPEVTVASPEGLEKAVPRESEPVPALEDPEPVGAEARSDSDDPVDRVVEYVNGDPAGPDRWGEDERNQRLSPAGTQPSEAGVDRRGGANRAPEGENMEPEVKRVQRRRKQSDFSEDDGTDPVSINIYCRGCSIRVDAACLSQLGAAGGILTGIAELLGSVPIMDTPGESAENAP